MKNITQKIKNTLSFLNSISPHFNVLNKQHSNTRTRKILNSDVLLFSLLYTDIEATQLNVATKIQLHYKRRFDVTSITKKINSLNIEVYSKLCDYIEKFYVDAFNISTEYYAVDGVYNNTNILNTNTLETNMNLCIYDVINDYPTDMIYSDVGKKNNELKILEQHIELNKEKYKNKCFICDRAYFSYPLFEYLHRNNIMFIIRIKKNAKESTVCKYPFLRVVRRKHSSNKHEDVIIATNIPNTKKSDGEILKLYSKRWHIEEYFKQLKYNNKFQYVTLESKDKLLKHYYSIRIMNVLKKILLELYKYITKYKEKTITSTNGNISKTHINENQLIYILQTDAIYKIIDGTFDVDHLLFLSKLIKVNVNRIDVSNKRVSKRPFTKWYIKSYHSKQNNINETYSVKYKLIVDPNIKQQLKALLKEKTAIIKKQKELIRLAPV